MTRSPNATQRNCYNSILRTQDCRIHFHHVCNGNAAFNGRRALNARRRVHHLHCSRRSPAKWVEWAPRPDQCRRASVRGGSGKYDCIVLVRGRQTAVASSVGGKAMRRQRRRIGIFCSAGMMHYFLQIITLTTRCAICDRIAGEHLLGHGTVSVFIE